MIENRQTVYANFMSGRSHKNRRCGAVVRLATHLIWREARYLGISALMVAQWQTEAEIHAEWLEYPSGYS